jgi:hypothetical protein
MADALKLADHFPRNPKPCRGPADKFFECFSTKGHQSEGPVSGDVVDSVMSVMRFGDDKSRGFFLREGLVLPIISRNL